MSKRIARDPIGFCVQISLITPDRNSCADRLFVLEQGFSTSAPRWLILCGEARPVYRGIFCHVLGFCPLRPVALPPLHSLELIVFGTQLCKLIQQLKRGRGGTKRRRRVTGASDTQEGPWGVGPLCPWLAAGQRRTCRKAT